MPSHSVKTTTVKKAQRRNGISFLESEIRFEPLPEWFRIYNETLLLITALLRKKYLISANLTNGKVVFGYDIFQVKWIFVIKIVRRQNIADSIKKVL